MARYVNKKHLEWVHSLDCSIETFFKRQELVGNHFFYPNKSRGKALYSEGIQAHHLLKPFYSERGMGLKAGDKDIMPLSVFWHTKLHRMGNELKFFEEVTGNAYFGHITVQKIWMSSPYYEK